MGMDGGEGFAFIDVFAGIGGFHVAAASLGGRCVFASEVDGQARRAYSANFGVVPCGDVRGVDARSVPCHDVLLAGFPCQPFSVIGKKKGFDDVRGTLFFEIVRILRERTPPLFVLENVKQLCSHDGGRTFRTILAALRSLGYAVRWKILNALDFGLPQKRERVIIVGFLDPDVDFAFPGPLPRGRLEDVLLPDDLVDGRFFASAEIVKKRRERHTSRHVPGIWHENKGGGVSSHPYSCALRAGASYNYLLVNGRRRLTPRELLRLQGFPDSFEIVCNDCQTRKQAGNAVPVNLARSVLRAALRAAGFCGGALSLIEVLGGAEQENV